MIPSGRGEIRIKEETTYGSDPTLAASNVKYVEDWSGQARRVMTQRTGHSPYVAGWMPVRTGQENTCSASFEMGTFTVPGTDTGARPHLQEALVMGGFKDLGWTVDYVAAGKDAQVYELMSHPFTAAGGVNSSVAIEERWFDEDGTDGVAWRYLGCRSDWEIVIEPGARWMMNHGTILAKSATAIATPSIAALTYAPDCPVVGSQTTVTIAQNSGAGDIGTLAVLNARLAANNNVQAQMGLSGTIGPSYITWLRQPATLTLTVEDGPDSTFDWEDMMDHAPTASAQNNVATVLISATNGAQRISLSSGDVDSNELVGMYMALQDVSVVAEVEGRRALETTWVEVYEDSSPGSEAVGITPMNSIAVVYNNGES